MKTSKTGYLRNSPDVNKPQNIIQGGDITMKGVDFKVLGTDDRGYTKIMQPGYDYKFPGAKYVTETPIKKTNMESNKQEKKNLLKDNPIASHGSWISKHSIAAGSPVHLGGSGKSPLYQDIRGGFQPNRANVELDKTTRLTRDSQVVKDRKSGEVVIGGGYDSGGKFIPKTAAQKALDRAQDPRNPKGSEAKKRYKARKEKEFNKPENVAKREANKAKLDAARKAKQERDKKKG
jgi:hypothetical protein